MNEIERETFEKYNALGYDVIRSGSPDLLLLKDGKIEFVEVKTERSRQLNQNQKRTINLLKKHGIPVRIEVRRLARLNLYSFPVNLQGRRGRPINCPTFPSWFFKVRPYSSGNFN